MQRALVWAYRLFPVVLLPLMLVLSRDFGVTWDEKIQQLYGERVWRFLTEGLDDDWFRPGELRMYLYGGLFDTTCVAVQRVLSGDIWMTRHYVNAAFGWLGIVYVGRLGRLLSGPGTGLLAMVLLTLSPRYFGDAMNNPKDLPLAALMAAALYYLMRLEPGYPHLGWRLAVPLALAIGLAVNVRSGALVLLAYLAIALVGADDRDARALPRARSSPPSRGGRASRVAVLLLGTVFWPWAQVRPLTRPLQGMITALAVPVELPGPLRRRRRAGDRAALDVRPAVGADHDATRRARGRALLSLLLVARRADGGRSRLAGARPVGRDALSRRATSC